jgi:hypothetical protein
VSKPPDGQVVALAASPADGPVWAASADCDLWRSDDGGDTWSAVDVPFRGGQLLALAASPEDSTPVLCSADGRDALLWRLKDGTWESWLKLPGAYYTHVAARGRDADDSWIAAGGEVWAHVSGNWEKAAELEEPVSRVACASDGRSAYVIVGRGVLRLDPSGGQTPMQLPEEAAQPLDVHVTAPGELLCLDAAGVAWKWE